MVDMTICSVMHYMSDAGAPANSLSLPPIAYHEFCPLQFYYDPDDHSKGTYGLFAENGPSAGDRAWVVKTYPWMG